jgi:hypothetical protein
METNRHDIHHLFHQLGLPAEPADIDAFAARHRLPAGLALCQAAFWNPTQARFLAQAVSEDSDWSDAADHLAVRLS